MKHLLLTLFLATSCIYIAGNYNDDFEGSWHSCQDTFEPFASDVELTIDKTSVSVYVDDAYIGTKDYRVSNGQLLMGWSVEWYGIDFHLLDATLTSEDDMLLRWKPSDFWYPYTTVYKREIEL